MVRLEGWQRVRNWLIPMFEPVVEGIRRPLWGAQAADKQPFVLLEAVALPVMITEEQAPSGDRTDFSLTTRVDIICRSGLQEWEVRLLADWLGGDPSRVLEVLAWVFRAHKRMELLDFPNFQGEPSIAMLRDVHPHAVKNLEQLLRQLVAVQGLTVGQTYSLLRQRLPGIEFPRCGGRADLQELLAVARNINVWCAELGTLPCGCSAIKVIP